MENSEMARTHLTGEHTATQLGTVERQLIRCGTHQHLFPIVLHIANRWIYKRRDASRLSRRHEANEPVAVSPSRGVTTPPNRVDGGAIRT